MQSATKARNLADRTFQITKKEQDLGAGSSYQTMTANGTFPLPSWTWSMR